jgi:hypothetical protein
LNGLMIAMTIFMGNNPRLGSIQLWPSDLD